MYTVKYDQMFPNFFLQIILPHLSQYVPLPTSGLHPFNSLILLFKPFPALYFDHILPTTANPPRSSPPPTKLYVCVSKQNKK